MKSADRGELAAKIDVAAIEHERFDRGLRYERAGRRIHACEAIAIAALVEFIRQAAHQRGAEDVGLKRLRSQDDARGIPRASGVHPREMAKQPLLAEGELLASETKRDRRLGAA